MAAVSRFFETIGRRTAQSLDEIGYGASLLGEALFWLLMGRRYRQPVRAQATMLSMLAFGVSALPIATLLSGTIGLMLAIQSLYSLGIFGAESFAYIGIAFGVVREFSPMIMGILIAGRSGSAIAARLATMTINQEIDALQVMGLNPVGEGTVIRVPLPELNEERRRDLTKVAHNYAEQARVAVRHVRRDGMELLKKLEKDGDMSEDDGRRQADLVQKATDGAVAEIDNLVAVKEREIMQV